VGAAALQGSYILKDGDGETVTLTVDDVASSATIKIPNGVTGTDEFCLVNLGNCSGAGQTSYIVVAANDSPAAIKATADYVADGTSDEDEINAALTAAAGGKVYLAEGTYVADGTILIPNNTTLAGAGRGTVIELADIDAT